MSSLLDGLPETQHNQQTLEMMEGYFPSDQHLHHNSSDRGIGDVSELYSASAVWVSFKHQAPRKLLEMLHVPLLHGGVKESFLLPSFTTSSDASFALACILLAVTACILELLRLALWYLEGGYLSHGRPGTTSTCTCKQCTFPVLSLGGERKNYNSIHDNTQQQVDAASEDVTVPYGKPSSRVYRWMTLAGVGVLQFLTYQGATMLMLVAMTMNIYLIVSLGVGATAGKVTSLYLKRHLQEGRK